MGSSRKEDLLGGKSAFWPNEGEILSVYMNLWYLNAMKILYAEINVFN